GPQLPPQPRRVRVERPRARPGPEAPDVAEQLVLREHAMRVRGEVEEQLVLLLREIDTPALEGDETGAAVDDERPRDEWRRGGAGAAQHRPHPLDELVVVERPREVVVAPAAERAHALPRIRLRGPEDDHRRLPAPALELGVVPGENEVGRGTRRGELEAVVPELPLEQATCRRLVSGQQHRRRHAATVAAASGTGQVSFAPISRRRILRRPPRPRPPATGALSARRSRAATSRARPRR